MKSKRIIVTNNKDINKKNDLKPNIKTKNTMLGTAWVNKQKNKSNMPNDRLQTALRKTKQSPKEIESPVNMAKIKEQTPKITTKKAVHSKLTSRILILLLVTIVGICTFGLGVSACGGLNKDNLLRLHIRANSNSDADQQIKLKVRDSVVYYLENELSEITSLSKAKSEIEKRKEKIKEIADSILVKNGFSYKSRIYINNEFFPTRMYEDVVLESGYYDALIIELGSGDGDNWWCVIYPPLCYVDVQFGGDFRYQSKIKELWDKYFG